MHLGLSVAAALASALLLWASSPSVGVGWLAWIALVPVAAASLALHGRVARLAAPLAFTLYLELVLVPALPFGLGHNQWGEPVIPILIADSPALVVAFLGIPLVGLILYALRFPQVVSYPANALGAAAFVVVPALAWTALDLARTKFDPGGLWGALFLSQHDTGAADLAALGGPWLLTFTIVAANYALALVVVRRRPALVPVAAVAAGVIAIVGVLSLLDERGGPRRSLTVAAVQPGYDTAEFELPVLHYLRRAYRNHERATIDLVRNLEPLTRNAAGSGAELVVWPEATAWVDPARNAAAHEALADLARETDTAIVVPYFFRYLAQGAAAIVREDGTVTRPQPKQRPMWFLGEDDGNHAPAVPAALDVDGETLRVGTLLGVDNQDPAPARTLAVRGADVLAASTHDWEQMAVQQHAFSRLHAAALGVPLVRADWRYGSVIIDADGRVVAEAQSGKTRAVVVADVAVASGATPYARIGDAFGWSTLASFLGLLGLALARTLLRRRATAGLPFRAAAQRR